VKTADAVKLIAERLAAAGVEAPRREARIILAAALNTDAAGILVNENISEDRFESLVARREAREPLAYILGRREFWGMEFMVSPATLIPRPDSETIIEAALAIFPKRNAVQRILDLGTGTGCLLLAALHEFPDAFGVGVDLAPEAAALARRNAGLLGLASRAAFLTGGWAAAISGTFDLILGNPPYIRAADLVGLMPEVTKFEPCLALDGGVDGLVAYSEIIGQLQALIAPGGAAILELGIGQAEPVAKLARAAGFSYLVRDDLGKIPRALVVRR
jgi:release factor glutamine methyltransferase